MLSKIYWLIVAMLTLGACYATYNAPTEATMGVIQKVFYIHLPCAICTFIACTVNFAASAGYLAKKSAWLDDLAHAAGRVAVQLCSVVLITGMIWGKVAWGQWWTWSPRLVFVLILWLLYTAYLLVRSSVESRERRGTISAAYALIAFLDVPLAWLCVKLLPDIHPVHVTLAPAMRAALGVWFATVFPLVGGLIVAQYRLNRQLRQRAAIAHADEGEVSATTFGLAGAIL